MKEWVKTEVLKNHNTQDVRKERCLKTKDTGTDGKLGSRDIRECQKGFRKKGEPTASIITKK